MTMSSELEPAALLAKALVRAQFEFPVIPKNSKAKIPTKSGGEYSFRYADLGDVVAAIKPILKNNGLAVLQFPTHDGNGRSTLTTYVMHEAGGFISHEMLLVGEGPDPKVQGTAITYARRYALCAALGIVADEDIDAAQGVDRSPAPPPAPPSPEEQALSARFDAIFHQASLLKELDGKDGERTAELRKRAGASVEKIKAWIAADPGGAEDWLNGQIQAVEAEKAQSD